MQAVSIPWKALKTDLDFAILRIATTHSFLAAKIFFRLSFTTSCFFSWFGFAF
jgi:hypothetical protein